MNGKIKEIRQNKGMSQREVEDKAGLSSGSLTRIESGEVDPSTTTLKLISDALGVEASKIL